MPSMMTLRLVVLCASPYPRILLASGNYSVTLSCCDKYEFFQRVYFKIHFLHPYINMYPHLNSPTAINKNQHTRNQHTRNQHTRYWSVVQREFHTYYFQSASLVIRQVQSLRRSGANTPHGKSSTRPQLHTAQGVVVPH